jgi:hypothetical protein
VHPLWKFANACFRVVLQIAAPVRTGTSATYPEQETGKPRWRRGSLQEMGGIYTAVCGAACLIAVRWYIPREMSKIRAKLVERGGSPARLDARMQSKLWRSLIKFSLPFGIFAILAGVVLFLTE